MENVAAEDLDVGHKELGLPVDDDRAGVAFLSSRLGVEVCSVEEETDGRRRGGEGGGGGGEEGGGVIDALECRIDRSGS
jgi:hypothetical protein